MLRDLVWGVVFFIIGGALIAARPPETPELFLFGGWASAIAGILLIARFAGDRMDDPLDEPWVDPHARWGDS